MKIAVFENEISQVEGSFKAFNSIYHDEQLEVKYFASSQEGEPFSNLREYSVVIIDIDLSLKSKLDGFHLIQRVLPFINHDKILIMTGLSDIEAQLEEKGIPFLTIIPKPISFEILHEKISPLLTTL